MKRKKFDENKKDCIDFNKSRVSNQRKEKPQIRKPMTQQKKKKNNKREAHKHNQ